ncbi:MAG: hypothetical protein AB7T06_30165 [Kofleriaceae bacterium]
MRCVVFAIGLALLGCGKQSSRAGGDVASCNLGSAGTCREYRGANLAIGSDSLARLCAIAKTAVFSMQACPTANLTGVCAQKEHTDYYYATYPIPATELEMACSTGGGTFRKAP